MAMPPRCYPPQPEFGRGRTAERRVWEVLRDQLPGDAALLHSVPMIERATEHEADLVIAWPGAGVAIVEVKGGHISRHHGQWYQSSGGETRPIKDPVVQAQDCKHVLHRLLVQRAARPPPPGRLTWWRSPSPTSIPAGPTPGAPAT